MLEFVLGLRIFIALILLAAGLSKIGRREVFRRAIEAYRIAPPIIVQTVAALLAPLELVLGILLLAGVETRAAAAAAAGLMLTFGGAMTVNLVRGRPIDCGCFGGSIERPISWVLVGRASALAACAVAVAAGPQTMALTGSTHGLSVTAVVAVLSAVAVAVLATLLATAMTRLRHVAQSVPL